MKSNKIDSFEKNCRILENNAVFLSSTKSEINFTTRIEAKIYIDEA